MSILSFSLRVMRSLFSRPATRRYPPVRRAPFAGSRGEIKIEIGECIFCGLCARRCPAQALAVDKPGRSWEIDPFRCVMCRLCVEVCPTTCLSQEPLAHPPLLRREKHKHVQAAGEKLRMNTDETDHTDKERQDR